MDLNFKQVLVVVSAIVGLGVGVLGTGPQYAEGTVVVSLDDKDLTGRESSLHTGINMSINNEDYFVEFKDTREELAQKIYDYGRQFMGLKYVWGGETPAGFDCSGFMRYIYGNFGVELPRVSGDQYSYSQQISPSEAEFGDLVFFYGTEEEGTADKIVHVGMYLGGGTFLQSGGPSDDVNVSTVNIYGKSVVFGRVL